MLFVGCANSFDPAPTGGEVEVKPFNITIEELHALTNVSGGVDVEGDLRIAGSVTANDEEYNIVGSLFVEQGGFGVEVLGGDSCISSLYPEGMVVTVSLRGLSLARSGGVLQVGVMMDDGSLGYLSHHAVVDQHLFRSTTSLPISPTRVSLSDPLLSRRLGSLVSVEGVKLRSGSSSTRWGGSHLFITREGVEFRVVTVAECRFAEDLIPMGEGRIVGVLGYDDATKCYAIKMRHANDYTTR